MDVTPNRKGGRIFGPTFDLRLDSKQEAQEVLAYGDLTDRMLGASISIGVVATMTETSEFPVKVEVSKDQLTRISDALVVSAGRADLDNTKSFHLLGMSDIIRSSVQG